MVAGLSTDLAIGFDLHQIQISPQVNGSLRPSTTLKYGAAKALLPAEFPIEPVLDGDEILITAQAFQQNQPIPLITRRAKTQAVAGRTILLSLSLSETCTNIPCDTSTTCIGGQCTDPWIAPSALPDYSPTWLASAEDACKTPTSGTPQLTIGQGRDSFSPVEENQVVPIEPGSQGGHHIWIALRIRGLRQMGSILSIDGYYPALDFRLLPFRSMITLHRTGGEECEIFGVRFQIDRDIPVAQVRGQALDMDIALEDPNGDLGTAQRRVVIEQ